MALPKELGLPSHFVAKKQVRCVYGTRDAGSIWEDVYRNALEAMGVTSGVASPCCFEQKERNIAVVVHGDDFTALGTDPNLNWYETEMAKHFEIKIRGRLGEGCAGDNELRILNRVVKVTPDGLTYEADPRHTDLLSESLSLSEAKAVATPGSKDPEPDYDMIKTDESNAAIGLSGEIGDSKINAFAFSSQTGQKFIDELKSKRLSDSPQRPQANLSRNQSVPSRHVKGGAVRNGAMKCVSFSQNPDELFQLLHTPRSTDAILLL